MSQQIQESSDSVEMPHYWDDDEVDHFITSEAHTEKKTPEQFRETHVNIDRIYADTLTPFGISGDFVTQENVLDAITASNLDDPNRIFIVRGEPGSGKSQLCEWTKYQINGYSEDDGIEDYVALHVSRSRTQIDQIIDILTEPLDIDINVRNIDDLDPDDAASAIVEYMRGIWSTDHLSDQELRELTENRGGQSDLREIFAKNIREYQVALESRDENPDFNLLTRADYRDLRLQLSFGGKLTENKDLLYPVLKNEAHEYLSRNLVGDFKEQLQEYSKLYQRQGIRPVLICEDLTTFSVLKEQLLDHIFELSSSNYDIVLGWTLGWEQDNIDDAFGHADAATYMKGRSEGYLTMTDEKGEAYFLDDDVSVALARSYINAIKRNSATTNAPDDIEDVFDNLYPFNERFIHIAYRQLDDGGSHRKTPRLLLLRVVKHCLKSIWPPYEAMKSNSFINTPAPNIAMKYDQRYLDVARWYGVPVDGEGNEIDSDEIPSDGGIGIQVGILEAFDIPLPENTPERGDYVVFDEGEASVILKRISKKTPDHGKPGGDDDGDETGGNDNSDSGDSRDDRRDGPDVPEEEKKVQEFLDWVKTGEKYPSADTIHDGALATLERWHEPTRLANPNVSTRGTGAIYYARGDNIPVTIQGALERQASIEVTVEWGEANVSLYRPMVEYGLLRNFDPQITNFDQLRAWADTNVTEFKHEMRDEIEYPNCLPEELTIEKTLVLAQFFLINAASGAEVKDGQIPAEIVFEDYNSSQSYGNPVIKHFSKDSAFGEAFSGLTMSSSDISDLIEGFFLLKSNVVDYESLSEARKEIATDFESHVDAAMMIDTGDLADAYKIGTTWKKAKRNTKVSTLFDRISDYAAELERLTVDEDASHIQDALEPVERWYDSSHTVNDLAEWFETLYKCAGAMDVPIKSSYDEIHEMLTESPEEVNLTAFRDDVERFQNMEDATDVTLIARLHDFARSQHELEAWEIYEAFDSLIDDLQDQEHATGTDLEHRIKQLDKYNDYEQKRQTIISLTEDL